MSAVGASPLKFQVYLTSTGPGEANLESYLLEILETMPHKSKTHSRARTSIFSGTTWLAVNQEKDNIRELRDMEGCLILWPPR